MLVWGSLGVSCAWSALGWAQSSKPSPNEPEEKGTPRDKEASARAQLAFEEARSLLRAKRFAEACEKFEESHALEPALGTLINWATCLELQGRLATAMLTYQRVIATAQLTGDESRKAIAESRIHRLEPSLSTIEIQVPSNLVGRILTIKLDGSEVPNEKFGQPLPVDGGEHQIRIELDGQLPTTSSVRVAPRHEHAVYLVPSLLATSSASTAPEGTTARVPVEGRLWLSQGEVKVIRANPVLQTTGGILAGLGAAALAVGGYYGVSAYRLNERSKDRGCDSDNQCTATSLETRRDAIRAGNVATLAFLAGGVLASSGTVLYLLGRPRVDGARLSVGLGSTVFLDWQSRF
jgi:tetratricopeptide (TPR) repeat protein